MQTAFICSPFHFLYNQQPMKIVFTSSYKMYFKDNTRNYDTDYYVLVFLISVNSFFFAYNMGQTECVYIYIYIYIYIYKNHEYI